MRFSRTAVGFITLSPVLLSGMAAGGQAQGGACEKPPKIVVQPQQSAASAKLKMFKAVGTVVVEIGESGDITEVKVRNVHPEAARDALIAVAKSVKFAPRHGCGPLQKLMIFSSGLPGKLQ